MASKEQAEEANGNSEAWKRLITHVQSGWIDPGNRVEAVLEAVMFLRNNPSDAQLLLEGPFEPEEKETDVPEINIDTA